MIRRPPRPTLFPSPPLSRSLPRCVTRQAADAHIEPHRGRGGRYTGHCATGCAEDRQVPERVLQGLDLRSEEHTSELQSRQYLVCRLLLEKKKIQRIPTV